MSGISFAKNNVFSGAQLRQEFPIQDGDVMSDQKIREGLDKMRRLYASKGYMELSPVPQVVTDDANRTVSIIMDVAEGPQFSVKGLTLDDDRQWPADKAAKLQAVAQSYSGSHDVGGFIEQVNKLLTEMFPGYRNVPHLVSETMGSAQHLVTLNVRYPLGGPN